MFINKIMSNQFETVVFSKLNLEFDRELFIHEYDNYIYPNTIPITNNVTTIPILGQLNEKWKMVPTDVYDTGDVFVPGEDFSKSVYVKRERPGWQFVQLMGIDRTQLTHPLLDYASKYGGVSFRNETLDHHYNFSVKQPYKDLEIVKWIKKTLPFKKLNSIHCVSIEPGGFSMIHRDAMGLYSSKSSAGINRVYKNGYVIINLNLSSGGVPLYWSLDGKDADVPYKVDDMVYLTNDYFFHGVPIVTSRRRQVRVMGIPDDSLWDLLDKSTMIDIGHDYQFVPNYGQWLKEQTN